MDKASPTGVILSNESHVITENKAFFNAVSFKVAGQAIDEGFGWSAGPSAPYNKLRFLIIAFFEGTAKILVVFLLLILEFLK